MNIFSKFKATLRLNEAIRQADKAHEEQGHRYYVLPVMNGKLIIVNRESFRKLKQKHYINPNARITNIENECFYCTSYNNGKGKLTPDVIKLKRKQYFSWLETIRK